MRGAIFLDRDGTINVQAVPGRYVTTRAGFRFLPGALDALAFLAQNSERRIVIVTNQSPIGRGMVTEVQVDELHAWMVKQIEAAGGRVEGVYVCPHAPDEGCACRKPAPGLFLDAAREMEIDLARSVMVGDTASDLEAAWAAGVPECYYVLTGRSTNPFPGDERPYDIYGGLADAARVIVEKER